MTTNRLLKRSGPMADNTDLIEEPDGSTTIRCRKGLWEVNGMDLLWVLKEAHRYFVQYQDDGEYSDDH